MYEESKDEEIMRRNTITAQFPSFEHQPDEVGNDRFLFFRRLRMEIDAIKKEKYSKDRDNIKGKRESRSSPIIRRHTWERALLKSFVIWKRSNNLGKNHINTTVKNKEHDEREGKPTRTIPLQTLTSIRDLYITVIPSVPPPNICLCVNTIFNDKVRQTETLLQCDREVNLFLSLPSHYQHYLKPTSPEVLSGQNVFLPTRTYFPRDSILRRPLAAPGPLSYHANGISGFGPALLPTPLHPPNFLPPFRDIGCPRHVTLCDPQKCDNINKINDGRNVVTTDPTENTATPSSRSASLRSEPRPPPQSRFTSYTSELHSLWSRWEHVMRAKIKESNVP
eukprot:Tbor_TRINITY_DN4206_c0_g1::TRINITY_DN4206_c0_g1_i2::g.23852::m.23852